MTTSCTSSSMSRHSVQNCEARALDYLEPLQVLIAAYPSSRTGHIYHPTVQPSCSRQLVSNSHECSYCDKFFDNFEICSHLEKAKKQGEMPLIYPLCSLVARHPRGPMQLLYCNVTKAGRGGPGMSSRLTSRTLSTIKLLLFISYRLCQSGSLVH